MPFAVPMVWREPSYWFVFLEMGYISRVEKWGIQSISVFCAFGTAENTSITTNKTSSQREAISLQVHATLNISFSLTLRKLNLPLYTLIFFCLRIFLKPWRKIVKDSNISGKTFSLERVKFRSKLVFLIDQKFVH